MGDEEIFASPQHDSDGGDELRMFRSELSRPKGRASIERRRRSSGAKRGGKEDGIMLDTHTGEGRLSMKGQGDESPSSSFASIVNMHIPLPSQVDEEEEEEEPLKKKKLKKKKRRRSSKKKNVDGRQRKYSSLDEEDDPEVCWICNNFFFGV